MTTNAALQEAPNRIHARPLPAPAIVRAPGKEYEARLATDATTMDDAYRLRYRSYLSQGHIAPNGTGSFKDAYDDLPTARTVVVYQEGRAVGSVRTCMIRPGTATTSPGRDNYRVEVDALMDACRPQVRGFEGVEVNRLVRAPESADDQGLVFTLLRLAGQLGPVRRLPDGDQLRQAAPPAALQAAAIRGSRGSQALPGTDVPDGAAEAAQGGVGGRRAPASGCWIRKRTAAGTCRAWNSAGRCTRGRCGGVEEGMMGELSTAATLAGIAYAASMMWAVQWHFRTAGRRPTGMKVISGLTLAWLGWWGVERWLEASRGSARPAWVDAAGLAATVVAGALFWWAIAETRSKRLTLAFSDDEPVFVVTTGPYALTKHPFYASYLLWWCAAAAECRGAWPWAMPAVMALIYARAAGIEEAKFASSRLAGGYAAYAAGRTKAG